MLTSRWLRSVGGAAIALTAACGGTENEERPSADPDAELEPLVDPGSAPPDCSADDGYEVRLIEDWETGAGRWYTNNEYCQPCADLENEIDDVSRPAKCLALEANSQTGCDPAAVGMDGDAIAGAVEDLKESVRWFLPNARPDDDEAREVADAFKGCQTDGTLRPLEEPCEGSDLFQELRPLVHDALDRTDELLEEFAECVVPCDPTQSPPTSQRPIPGQQIPGGRCGSEYAVHIRLNRWLHRDGVLGRQFSPTEPFDASEYEGVSFWMRNVPGARSTFRMSAGDAFTDERSEVDGEPVCTFINPKELTDDACDEFGRYFLTTSDWQFFTIPFNEMRQNGYGKQAPFLDIANLMGLSLRYKQGHWDYWIDDIGFYRKK